MSHKIWHRCVPTVTRQFAHFDLNWFTYSISSSETCEVDDKYKNNADSPMPHFLPIRTRPLHVVLWYVYKRGLS